jgi:DNA-binding LytR/AlgR family response regulator
MVPLDRIVKLVPAGRGDWTVILTGGTTLVLSRTYRRQVMDRIRPMEPSAPGPPSR